LDVGIWCADLPKGKERYAVVGMQAEHQRQANLSRSDGKQEVEVVRAQTDNEKEVFPAGAFPEAEGLDGCEAATATRIYAEA
jgi:hypothetical protein